MSPTPMARASSSSQRSPWALTTAQGIIHRRHFRATKPEPIWLAVGAGCLGLYVGTRYILRAQERMRRRREGLPVDDDDDNDSSSSASRRQIDRILGLDFGTSNLRLATASVMSAMPPRVIENAEGLRATPAAVAVENDSVLVGALAKSLQGRKPGYTATATRLLLGQSPTGIDADDFIKSLPYKVEVQDGHVQLVLDGTSYSTEWAAEVMLDYANSVARRSFGDDGQGDDLPVVLTVPVGAPEAQRAALERVAVTAGFDVVSSIEEPVAALHAVEKVVAEEETAEEFRGAFSGRSSGPIAVFDMGGFSSSFSILERTDSTYSVLASASTTSVSGTHVDSLLFRRVIDRFYQEVGIDLSIDHMASYRVLEAVEAAKVELSSRKSTDINLPFITADRTGVKHLVQKLSTFDLSRVLESPVKDATKLCDAVLKDAGIRKEDIGLLVLIGGGVRTEYMKTELERFFNLRAFGSKDFRPEEAVVVGATEFGRRLVLEDAS